MKITSEELAKTMGIKIGDRIRFPDGKVADITEDYQLDYHPGKVRLAFLVDGEFEILSHTKKVGEQVCADLFCSKCPLWGISCGIKNRNTLYDKLNKWNENHQKKEIYDILKVSLDKEVE